MSPVNCPFTVRITRGPNFGARVEAIFSARLTICIGSDSQSDDDAYRLLPFLGTAQSQGPGRNWLSVARIVCFRC
jgi:hypothetical protein